MEPGDEVFARDRGALARLEVLLLAGLVLRVAFDHHHTARQTVEMRSDRRIERLLALVRQALCPALDALLKWAALREDGADEDSTRSP